MSMYNYSRAFATMVILTFLCLFSSTAEAQILKKIGNKIEKSVDRRIERKIDKGVEKGLDSVEDGVDQSVKDASAEKPTPTATERKKETAPPSFHEANEPYSEADARKAKANNGMVLVPANCNEFAWFKSGAIMEFEMNSSSAKKTYQSRIEVRNVRTEGNKTIADVTSSDNEGHEMEMNYICSGNQLYFDMTDMLKSVMEKQGQSTADMEISFDGGLMSIPKNIYPGQKLEDAVFVMNMTNQGMKISMTSYLKERNVVGTETVTTPAGTFQCIKITGVRTTQMKLMGTNRKVGEPVIEEMYFAPALGIIKSVSKTKKGKVESEQQLVKYAL